MSTYDQAIANLKTNNWQTTNNIITYNNDVAKFKTQEYQNQAKLFSLAGQTGFELTKKIIEKRKTDQENELLMQWVTGGLGIDLWNQSEEAQVASESLTNIAKFQNNINNNVTGNEINKGLPSNIKDEARFSTGIAARMNANLRLSDLKNRFSIWAENEKRTNEGFFYVDFNKDGNLEPIRINDPNLNFNQKVALQRHLTKEYFNLHNLQNYSKEFLLLPKERGGSGFLQSMLETNQTYFKDLQTQHKLELSESAITLGSQQLGQLKTAQSFEDLFSQLYAGYDGDGNNLGFKGAWKRMHDKIMPALIESYKLSPDDIIRLGDTVKIQIPDEKNPGAYKEVLLKDYRKEWGKGSKWHNEALEAWKNKGEVIKNQNAFKLEEFIGNTKQAINDGLLTSKEEKNDAFAYAEDLNSKGHDIDLTPLHNILYSDLTKPEVEIQTRNVIDKLKSDKNPRILAKDLKGIDPQIKNHYLFQNYLKEEKENFDAVTPILRDLKVNEGIVQKELGEETFKTGQQRQKWKEITAYATKYYKDNKDKKSDGEIQEHLTKWINEQTNHQKNKIKPLNLGVYDRANNKWVNANNWGDTAPERDILNNRYVKDTNGYMPNIDFKNPNVKEIIVTDDDAKEVYEAYGDTLPYQNVEQQLTDPNYTLDFETEIWGEGVKPDYNARILNQGYADPSLIKEAKRRKITIGQLITYRHKALGLGKVDPKILEYFSEKNLSIMDGRIKDVILGYEPDNGQYTKEQQNHEFSKNSNPGDISLITFGEKGSEVTFGIDNIAYKKLNKDGSTDDSDVKLGHAYLTACVASISNTAINDTTESGTETLANNLSEIPPDQLAGFCQADPKVGWYAYGAGAPIDVLKVVPELQETKGKESVNKISNALQRFLGTNVGNETSLQSGTNEPEDMGQYYQIPEPNENNSNPPNTLKKSLEKQN